MYHMDGKIDRLGGLRRRKSDNGWHEHCSPGAKKGDSTGRERVAVVVD